jgi:hypothetical protein
MRTIVAAGIAVLMLGGCGGTSEGGAVDGLPSFQEAVDSAAPCSELFEIRNSWDPKSPMIEPANQTLRSIGCYSATSERTD